MNKFYTLTNDATKEFTICLETDDIAQCITVSQAYINDFIGTLLSYRHMLQEQSRRDSYGNLESGVVASHLHSHLVSGD